MCILCVVQRWSRRIATMLPWLVVPLIFLWAVSQFLPPGLRFEVTSPRLACVLVLLVTLFWYEILMPRLSLWRARRSARLRERRRAQAIELQKLRRTATRRCRNCHTPYRDQNPGGGRFMCSYCGHISKRPVLDLPVVPPASSASAASLISDLVGKNNWVCTQEWSSDTYWEDSGCVTEKSYSGALLFSRRLLACFCLTLRWLWRKIFRFSSREDGSSDGDSKGLSKRGECGANCQESQKEKARRKAEEKRQARLEKEMLEEEERKQREEVARLVEERRKLRDAKLEAERRSRISARDDRISRKETERRRQESRRDKDKGSSKSNSDVEEFDRRAASKESEKKCELDRKNESERRDTQKSSTVDNYKFNGSEAVHGVKPVMNRTRYFDRVKGSFLSSSRGLNGASFWGRGAKTPVATVSKVTKPVVGFVDNGSRRDAHPVIQTTFNRAVGSDVKPPTQKKGWLQLFTRSSDVSPTKDSNISSYSGQSSQEELQNPPSNEHKVLPVFPCDKQGNIGQPLPLGTYPLSNGSFGGSPVFHSPANNSFTEKGSTSVLEEQELFEDPCYIPDPVSLLGPISDSLDNLPVDLGAGFIANSGLVEPISVKKVVTPADICKPSPIAAPLRVRISEERYSSDVRPSTPKSKHTNASSTSNSHEQGTWQMWGSPSAHDGLGLVSRTPGWFSPVKEDVHPMFPNSMLPQILTENHVNHRSRSPISKHQNGGIFVPRHPTGNGHEPWAEKDLFQSLPLNDRGDQFPPLNSLNSLSKMAYDSSTRSAAGNPFELPPVDSWSKREWGRVDPQQDVNSLTTPGVHVGGLFSTGPDVQSVWAFDQKENI